MEINGLQQHGEDLKVELRCPLPGCNKKWLCQKKWINYKVAVFYFFIFLSIYKKSSEFWKKVNFSGLESYWVSRLVTRCRVTLQASWGSKALRSPKIDVRALAVKITAGMYGFGLLYGDESVFGLPLVGIRAFLQEVSNSELPSSTVTFPVEVDLLKEWLCHCLWAWFHALLDKIMACDFKINFLTSKVILW